MSGRFSYEFACDISKRVPRVYIKDGKEWGESDLLRINCSTTHVYTEEKWKY